MSTTASPGSTPWRLFRAATRAATFARSPAANALPSMILVSVAMSFMRVSFAESTARVAAPEANRFTAVLQRPRCAAVRHAVL